MTAQGPFARRVAAPAALVLALVGPAGATAQGEALWVVSRPPPPVLPSDPPRGVVFAVPTTLDRSAVALDPNRQDGAPIGLAYLAVAPDGTVFATFDDGPDPAAPGGVRVLGADLDDAAPGAITGRASALVDPRDAIVVEAGAAAWLVVADHGARAVVGFATSDRGDAAPRFVLPHPDPDAAGGSVWGVLHDAADDRLFVSTTDGRVLVYDAFTARLGDGGPDRVIVPTQGGAKVATNLHGLAYDAATGALVVTDVGAATTAAHGPEFARDGALLVVADAATADGPTEVRARIAGDATLLGNPIDVALTADGVLYVAEGANDLLLRFDGVLDHVGAQTPPPDGALGIVAPESVLLRPTTAPHGGTP